MSNISIGPVLGNPETVINLAFGNNVSASRVIDFVKRNVDMRQSYGMISENEATEMVKLTEEELKKLNMLV